MRDEKHDYRWALRKVRKANRQGVYWEWQYIQTMFSVMQAFGHGQRINRTHRTILELIPRIEKYADVIRNPPTALMHN